MTETNLVSGPYVSTEAEVAKGARRLDGTDDSISNSDVAGAVGTGSAPPDQANAALPSKAPDTNAIVESKYAPYLRAARYSSGETYPPREWIVKDLLARGTMNTWIGPEKSRKSCFALRQAMYMACGKDHDGFTVPKARTVVYVSAEDPSEELDLRYKQMFGQFAPQERALIEKNLNVIKGREMFVNKGLNVDAKNEAFWTAFAAQYPAEVYFLDALQMFHSGSSNDQMRDTLLRLRSYLGPKNCLVILHHTRKKDDKEIGGKQPVWLRKVGVRAWSDKANGAGALKRIADVIMCQEFREVRNSNGDVTDESTDFAAFGKIIEDIPLLTYEDDGLYSYRLVRDLSAAVSASLDKLRRAGGPWASKNTAAHALSLSRSQGNVHIRELIRKQYLRGLEDGSVELAA